MLTTLDICQTIHSTIQRVSGDSNSSNKMLDRSPRWSVSNFRDRVGGGSVNIAVMSQKIECRNVLLRLLAATSVIEDVRRRKIIYNVPFIGGLSMSVEAKRCLKCNSEMVQGFIFGREGPNRIVSTWVEGRRRR